MASSRPTDMLRSRAARGVLVNASFTAVVRTLSLIKGFAVAAFLSSSEYGIWGILVVGLGTLSWLRQIGIVDKYVQQADDDAEAFQTAFTLELIYTAGFTALVAVTVPVLAFVYGESELLLPGFAIVLGVPAAALQAPTWIFYRSMDFVRQRILLAVDPVVSFVVTVGLAAAGADYWSLVAGFIAGAWAAALTAVRFSPHPVRVRRIHGLWREYLDFSWPLVGAALAGIVIAQGTMLVGEAELGLAGAGAIALAATITQYTDEVDKMITNALYPAISVVRDKTDLLHEAFVKSNRLALMWAVPFGIGLSLFAPDLVDFVLGERWEPATTLIQVFGLAAALNHVGFNWQAFYMARGETRPSMVVALAATVSFLVVTVPLLIAEGLDGLAIGTLVMSVVLLLGRQMYMARLFQDFRIVVQLARAFAPTLPAAAAVLVLRLLQSGERDAGWAAAEFGLYAAVTVVLTIAMERELLREAVGYVRGPGGERRG